MIPTQRPMLLAAALLVSTQLVACGGTSSQTGGVGSTSGLSNTDGGGSSTSGSGSNSSGGASSASGSTSSAGGSGSGASSTSSSSSSGTSTAGGSGSGANSSPSSSSSSGSGGGSSATGNTSSSSGSSSGGSSSSGGGAPASSGSSSGSGGVSSPSTSDTLTFPIEVLGAGSPGNSTVAEVSVGINSADVSNATALWFQCHRCGFYAAPEFEATTSLPQTIKASVRVIGGGAPANDASVPWVNITDATVQLADAERVQGGVNGAFFTTRITLPLTATMKASLVGLPSYNRIQFRFNGTDGSSNGFRILALQVQDGSGNNLLTNPTAQADPTVDRSVAGIAQSDVTAGKTLWYATNTLVKSSIVTRKLQAACNSCHAKDGLDLQYFNYSNNSIIQRSQFHGLTAAQGQQIVAFIRSTQQQLAYAANARPWNPPYQPGPGLDCTGPGCEVNWAAGAGLNAVLQNPSDAVNALFGKPVGGAVKLAQSDIDAVMNPAIDTNLRQTQIALQFPDWNAWLPAIHPADIWPQVGSATNASFNTGAIFTANPGILLNPNGLYQGLVTWLTANVNPNGVYGDWSHLTPSQRNTIQQMFNQFGWTGYYFIGGSRGAHIASSGEYGSQVGAANMQQLASAATMAVNASGSFTTNAFIERAVDSVLHWNIVKQWEMAKDFGLEGNQQWFIGDYDATANTWTGRGEAHGWPYLTPGIFYVAPHMEYQTDTNSSGQITRQYYMSWQANDVIGSYYNTNQWYQLAMTVNPGGRSQFTDYPIDWDYTTAFDDLVAQTLGSDTASQTQAQMHYVREVMDTLKEAQYVDNNLALYDPTQPVLTSNVGFYSRAEDLRHQMPSIFMDLDVGGGVVYKSNYHFLDNLQSGLYLEVINGFINQFNVLYSSTQPSAWRRCDPNNTSLGESEIYVGFCLDPTYTPLGTNSNGTRYILWNNLGQSTNEEATLYSIYKAGQLGAEPTRLQTMSNWANAAWPQQ